MNIPTTAHPGRWWIALASLLIVVPAFAQDDDPKPDSPLVRLLKGSAKSAERQGRIIDQIGKRGTADDLGFLFREAIKPEGFPPENRVKALDALAEAASTRNEKPGDVLDSLGGLIAPKFDGPTRVSAARLAGVWKVAGVVGILRDVATKPDSPDGLKAASIESVAEIGGEPGRGAIEGLAADKSPKVRALAIAALARFDENDAAKRAASALKDAKDPGVVEPLMAAFLNRQGGADTLANAIEAQGLAADPAKLALRSLYALGRSDAALSAALTKAAGLDAEPKAPDAAEMDRLMAEVASKGNAARGESIFRRADLNCTKCHALAGAGGGVGPDLSSVGSSSPVDYIVNSIMVPDQAIKEVYQTQIILTTDGRIFQGIVADKDASKIVLREANGDLRTIPAAEVEASKEGGSLMPKGLVNFMTRGEFVDLVRFLSELGKPGPYAIRSTPTIQRWRLLESADPLAPVYAKVSGDLPLDELAKPGSPLTLKGDLDVTADGPLTFRFDSAHGVTASVDEKPVEMAKSSFDVDLSAGHHVLTLKVDRSKRSEATIRVEVVKPEGSSAEYTVVGGR